MQLLFEESEEGGHGLGLLRGPVRRVRARRVPHMGWNELRPLRQTALLAGLEGADVYFAHSYACDPEEPVAIAETEHDGPIVAADARALLRAGADKVAVNRAALEEPELLMRLAEEFGSQAVVCAIDARGGEVVTHAGTRPRGIDAVVWAGEAAERGAGELLVTSIDADGTREGYDLELTGAIAEAGEVPVIASGGAGCAEHLAEPFAAGAEAALVASIVHEDPERLPRLKAELEEAGWPVRT